MKKTISKLIALLMVAMMLVAALPFASLAEAPADDEVTVEVEVERVNDEESNITHYELNYVITIGKDVNLDRIDLTDLAEKASGLNEQPFMPINEFKYNFKIINNSSNAYTYLDESATLHTFDFVPSSFVKGSTYVDNIMNRLINRVLTALGATNSRDGLSDASIGAKLRAKGYGADTALTDEEITQQYLDDYYVDYYNQNNGEDQDVDTFQELPLTFIVELMKDDGFGKSCYWYTDENGYEYTLNETNNVVAEYMGARYWGEYGYLVNAEDIKDTVGDPYNFVADKTTDEYARFNEKFGVMSVESGKTVEADEVFNMIMSGEKLLNHYQSYFWEQELSFTLVKSGSEKIDLPGSEKWIVVNGEEVAHDNIAAGEDVNFILKSNIGEDFTTVFPEDYPVAGEDPNAYGYTRDDFGQYTFKFVDKYDPAFIIPTDAGDYVVKVNGTQLTTDQYTLTMVTAEDGTLTFEIAINDLVQLFLDGVFNYEDIGVAPITVEYTAQTGEDLTAGNYVNESWVEYNGTPTEHSTVDVSTYKISVFKYDQATDEPLAGATFALYDVNPSEEGNENVEPIATGVTGEDGYVIFDGLDVGTYYLVETEAPNGYVCDSSVHEVNIVADETTGYAENQEVEFPNVSVPHTGGEGTRMFYTVGGAILACAAAAYVVSRKKAGSLA